MIHETQKQQESLQKKQHKDGRDKPIVPESDVLQVFQKSEAHKDAIRSVQLITITNEPLIMTASLDKFVKIFRMYDETDENLAGTLKQGYMMKPELIKVCKVLAPNPEFDMHQQLKAVLEDPSYAHFFNIREGCPNPLEWALKQGYVIKQGWVMYPGYQWNNNLQSQFSQYDSNSQKRKVDLLSYVSQLQQVEDPFKRKEKIATEREVNARAGLRTGYGS